jgi:sugar phosphate isomerase/epimerase
MQQVLFFSQSSENQMKVEAQEFMNEQTQALADQAEKFRRNPQRFMRRVLVDSAEGLKSLKRPLRMVAHSGVKLTEVSQTTLQSLIELQSEVVTSTLTAVAKRLERAASAEGVADLVLDQLEMLPATRDRIVDEAARGIEILKVAGRDVRKIANHTYATVTGRTDEELAVAKRSAARKVKRVVRKTRARARKLAA